ncbi:MAG: HAD hydrolase-like protein [Candidatus Uhrbacteria bacterium]|nr:HAD hydrolase-like protein [Candidatus Uhrbacteria bacterium]
MEQQKKTLLFDFDGVMVDSFQLSYESKKKSEPNIVDIETYRRYFDGNIFEVAHIKESLADQEDNKPSVTDPFFIEYIPALMAKEPIPSMVDALHLLSKDYRLVIISSTISSPIEEYLRMHDIYDLFDKVYGSDVHTSKIIKIKMAFEDYNLSVDSCVFITDTLGDMREAAKAGVRSIGVTWGFHKTDTLKRGNPIALVDSADELVAVIRQEILNGRL